MLMYAGPRVRMGIHWARRDTVITKVSYLHNIILNLNINNNIKL